MSVIHCAYQKQIKEAAMSFLFCLASACTGLRFLYCVWMRPISAYFRILKAAGYRIVDFKEPVPLEEARSAHEAFWNSVLNACGL